MKKANLVVIFLLLVASASAYAQSTELALPSGSAVANYRNLPVGELNKAYRQQLSGQFEMALMTYNSALAWQPNWVPALAARSELLNRLGRRAEARADRQLATRQNNTATAFFLAKGQHGLMPFMSLYPKDWYTRNYGFADGNSDAAAATLETYFYRQHANISSASDSSLAVIALQQKLDYDMVSARRTLELLPRNYNPAVRKLLLANLAMLNHDYSAAINLYTDAELQHGVDWPELHYNRGLSYILMHNYGSGCPDLEQAARAGFEPARTMLSGLCNF